MPKNAIALKKLASSGVLTSALVGVLATSSIAAASSVLSEPSRAYCRAPGLNWSLVVDFDKFDAASSDGESEISFLSNQASPDGGLARESSYQVLVRKVSQFPEIDFDSYRVVFGEESSNFILSLPRDRKGKSVLTRAYLSTDGQTQNLACSVSLKEPDALSKSLVQDLDRKRAEARVSEAKLPPQVCAIDYLDEKTGDYEFGCSATIISDRDLLTAGHCQNIYRDRLARARCPGQPAIAIDAQKSSHHEKHIEDMWNVAYDIAILRLTQPVSTEPADIAPNTEAVRKAIFEHPERCSLYGYGRELDGHIGRLHGVQFQFPPDELGGRAFTETNFSEEHMISTDPRLFLRGGDSGGPILCASDDEDGAPIVVGVHSILFALDSSVNSSSVGFNAAWIHDHMYAPPAPAPVPVKLAVQAAADDDAVDAASAAGSSDAGVSSSGASSGTTTAAPAEDTAPIHVDRPVKIDTDASDEAPIIESSDD